MPDIMEQLVELFHASPTKGDPARQGIYPFRARANPHISKGEGQGRGFYGWGNKNDAIHFALNTILNASSDPVLDYPLRSSAAGANIFRTRVQAKHLIPDAELSFKLLLPLLQSNPEKVNQALVRFKQLTGSDVLMGRVDRPPSNRRKLRTFSPSIFGVEVADDTTNDWNKGDLIARVGYPQARIAPPAKIALKGDIDSARILGPLLKALKTSSPNLYRRLLQVTLEGRGPVRSRVASPLELVKTLGKK